MSFYILNAPFYHNFYYLKSVVDRGTDFLVTPSGLQNYVDNLSFVINNRGMAWVNLNFQPNEANQPAEFNDLMDSIPFSYKMTNDAVLENKYGKLPFREDKFYCQNQRLLESISVNKVITEENFKKWHPIVRNVVSSISRKMDEESRELVSTTVMCSAIEVIGFSVLADAVVARLGPERQSFWRNPRVGIFTSCIIASNLLFKSTLQQCMWKSL